MSLIERQAAIELAMQYCPDDDGTCSKADEDIRNLLDELEGLPSAQPDIIHCKDCKYWQDQEEGIVEVPICARPQNKYEKHPFIMIINGNGFCSYAERRTDESD